MVSMMRSLGRLSSLVPPKTTITPVSPYKLGRSIGPGHARANFLGLFDSPRESNKTFIVR